MKDFFNEAIRGTLAVLGAAYTWATSSKGVATITVLYILLQMLYLGRKWYCEEHRRGRK